MKFNLPVIAAFLAAIACASPVPEDPGSPSVDDCDDIRYENETTDGSPTVDDCKTIVDNISTGGSWDHILDSHRTLVTFGTCAVGIDGPARVGNTDITDIINDSIAQFEWNGLVGSKGQMNCQQAGGQPGTTDVTWGLYFNPDCCE
ncbi:hypothetical protein PHISCL_00964 [Aspergillus sclerotialis]|uniref:Ecp2 effector protein-like domain-containing protein n=1 Tax=Aspergillus sclerotialis TaxID=2070753 RepID=A0A3A2ZWM0_9EURO|nr:hypothetical protein PHISCL_00964 [Aspergillus sclerotialis]